MPTELFFIKKSFDLIKILGEQLFDIRKNRAEEINEIERTFGNLDYLVPFYVVPDAQNVNPADLDEEDTGLVAKNNIFDLLDSFFSGPPRYSHAFVLSDAGMGKSSLLIMLNLFYINKFIQPDFQVHLCKIGDETIDEINKIKSPQNTILLLDALDEDREAWESFYNRMQLLLQATQIFRKVVITCRTQFFPIEYEEDGRVPGVVILGGFHCSKLFLSPFTDKQVDEYLKKRFSDKVEREKAKKIVSRMNSLKFRPMLLSYVDYFIDSKKGFNDAYSVYEILVEEWLNRELRKSIIKDKEEIFKACTAIANHMYKEKKKEINFTELRDHYAIADKYKNLEYMTIEGRSLLHRNSEGNFKFAHYSILEYFVARSIVNSSNSSPNSDQVIKFIADMLINHRQKKVSGLDLRNIEIRDNTINKVNFSKSILSNGDFSTSKFIKVNFYSIIANNADFSYCILDKLNFDNSNCKKSLFIKSSMVGASLKNAVFSSSDFSGSNLSNADFEETNLDGCNFSNANLAGVNFKKAVLSACDFRNTDLSKSNIDDAIMKDALYDNNTRFPSRYNQKKQGMIHWRNNKRHNNRMH